MIKYINNWEDVTFTQEYKKRIKLIFDSFPTHRPMPLSPEINNKINELLLSSPPRELTKEEADRIIAEREIKIKNSSQRSYSYNPIDADDRKIPHRLSVRINNLLRP